MSNDIAVPERHWIFWALTCWVAALVLTFAGMVSYHHAGPWKAAAAPKSVAGAELQVVRGAARYDGRAIVIERPAEDGTLIVSAKVDPPMDASLYRFAQVRMAGAFPRDGLSLVWQVEKGDGKVRRVPVVSSGGRVVPAALGAVDGWSGRIVGVGLVARGELRGPLAVESIDFQPSSGWTTVDAMVSDWLEFEPWDGGSIHFMAGGNPSLRHPLPLFLGTTFLVAIGLYLFLVVLGHTSFQPQAALAIALIGWALIDLRWQANLWKQLDITRFQYAGKSWEDKRRAAEDGRLFEFMREARAKIGDAPAHVYVFAEEEFDRVRGAYHLYPKNVTVQPKRPGLLPAATFKPGDVIVLYRKRGVEYNPAEKRLRWEGTQALQVEMIHFAEGSAVLRVLGAAG